MFLLLIGAWIWQPYFVPWGVLAATVVVMGAAVWMALRCYANHPVTAVWTAIMRLVVIVALAVILLGPSVLPPQAMVPARGKLTLMVDTSASMLTPDADGQSRYDFVVRHWLDESFLQRLRSDYEIQFVAFDKTPRVATLESLRTGATAMATGRVSHVARSVADRVAAARAQSPGGHAIVLMSDGRDSLDEPMQSAARLAAARSIPIHTVSIGGPTMRRDLAVVAVPMQEYLLAEEQGQIAVRVVQTNAGDARTTLKMRVGDELETREIVFAGAGSVKLDLPVQQEQPGLYEYQFEVQSIAGEVEKRNNHQSVFLEVTKHRMKVLVLEGKPYWDTKFLAQSLRKDERIELTHITQIASNRQEKIVTRVQDPTGLPRSLTELCAYDVIILGRGIEHVLDPQVLAELPTYVSKFGGRVVFARGRAYNPNSVAGRDAASDLRVIEPVLWGQGQLANQALALEPAGRMHPALGRMVEEQDLAQVMSTLPPLTIVPVVAREKPAAQVLARTRPPGAASAATGQPALVAMPYNRGMVLAIIGDGLWRWSLLGKKAERFGGVFDRFWSGMVRWLVMGGDYQPGRPLALRVSRRSVQSGNELHVDLIRRPTYHDLEVHVRLYEPAGISRQLALGPVVGADLERAVLRPTEAGVYRVVAEPADPDIEMIEAKFNVYDVDLERLRSSADPAALRLLAEQSGGQFLNRSQPEQLLEVLSRYRATAVVPPRPQQIWDSGWLLGMLLLWAGIEWIVRKLGGLL